MVLPIGISLFTSKRRSEAEAGRQDILLAKELSRRLKEGSHEEIVKLIPLVQSVLQDSLFDVFDGRKAHVIGINTEKGVVRIAEKDSAIYSESRPSFLNKHPEPARDYILSISDTENNIFQAIIDRTNFRLFKFGELKGVDNEGTFSVGSEEIKSVIQNLINDGRKVADRGRFAYGSTEYELGLTPAPARTPEGDYSPPEERG